MAEQNKAPEKKTLSDKLFKNEHGEISLTKVGVIAAAVGGALAANPIAPVVAIVAKYLIALGSMCGALGALSKKGRR